VKNTVIALLLATTFTSEVRGSELNAAAASRTSEPTPSSFMPTTDLFRIARSEASIKEFLATPANAYRCDSAGRTVLHIAAYCTSMPKFMTALRLSREATGNWDASTMIDCYGNTLSHYYAAGLLCATVSAPWCAPHARVLLSRVLAKMLPDAFHKRYPVVGASPKYLWTMYEQFKARLKNHAHPLFLQPNLQEQSADFTDTAKTETLFHYFAYGLWHSCGGSTTLAMNLLRLAVRPHLRK